MERLYMQTARIFVIIQEIFINGFILEIINPSVKFVNTKKKHLPYNLK